MRVQPVEEEGGDGAHGDPAHAAGHERAMPGVRRGGGRGMNRGCKRIQKSDGDGLKIVDV